jgi:hypothetical protein
MQNLSSWIRNRDGTQVAETPNAGNRTQQARPAAGVWLAGARPDPRPRSPLASGTFVSTEIPREKRERGKTPNRTARLRQVASSCLPAGRPRGPVRGRLVLPAPAVVFRSRAVWLAMRQSSSSCSSRFLLVTRSIAIHLRVRTRVHLCGQRRLWCADLIYSESAAHRRMDT